jgi:hypothetical protein
LAVNPTAPTTQQYLPDDGQGHISTVTGTDQTVACTVRFDPWGTPLSPQGTNPCNCVYSYLSSPNANKIDPQGGP